MSNWLQRNLESGVNNVLSNLATIGVVAALGLIGALVLGCALIFEDAPITASIALAMIALAGLTWCAVGVLWIRDRGSRGQSQSPDSDGAVKPSVVFSGNRNDRDYIRMVKDAGHRVRVVWNSGGGLKRAHRLEELFPCISAVLLPHPDVDLNPALADLALAAESKRGDEKPERRDAAIEEVRHAIEEVTAEIKEYNTLASRKGEPTIEVWWRKGSMGNLITLAEDWVFIEMFVPGLRASYRPGIQIFKTGTSDEPYEYLERAYKYMLAEADDAFATRGREA